MKSLDQIFAKKPHSQSEGIPNASSPSEENNSMKQNKNHNFDSENPDQLSQLDMKIRSSEFPIQQRGIKDLVNMIAKLPKSQINITSKLFLQLGIQLNQQPEKISQIKPQKGFLSNLIEFTRKLKENQEISIENPKKICRLLLNSLLYILMLLLTGYKERNTTLELKQKLFQNKAFINHFLGIEIYKHTKISKLYGLIIVQIYKNNPSQNFKKNLVSSIIMNLKHIQHSKTGLNLAIILDQLKLIFRLKLTQVTQQNLIERVEQIYYENRQTFQSVHALNYLLHLVYEFPQLRQKLVSKNQRQLEITENIRSFILSSKLFQKSFIRYLEWNFQCISEEKIVRMIPRFIADLQKTSLSQQVEGSVGRQKWILFLLTVTQIIYKTIQNGNIVLWMLENGLITTILEILKKYSLNCSIRDKTFELIQECLTKVQFSSNNLQWPLLCFIISSLNQIPEQYQSTTLLQKNIMKLLKNKSKNYSKSTMNLE